jgi:hypothetical protein
MSREEDTLPVFVREIQFEPDDPRRAEVRAAHLAHLATLHERGELLTSGPWATGDGAMLVYVAPDESAARRLVEADPFFTERVVTELSLRQWNRVFPKAADGA